MFYSYIRIIKNKLKKMKSGTKLSLGLAQIPLLIGLLIMAIAVPVATKLVQQNQTNQGKAASSDTCTKDDTKCVGGLQQTCKCGYLGDCAWWITGLRCTATTCTEGSTRCSSNGGSVEKCISNVWTNVSSCIYGCSGGVCNGSGSATCESISDQVQCQNRSDCFWDGQEGGCKKKSVVTSTPVPASCDHPNDTCCQGAPPYCVNGLNCVFGFCMVPSATSTPKATATPTTGSGGGTPPPGSTPTTKPTSPPTGGCREECPSTRDGVLRNCTPPDTDGTSSDSSCDRAGRVEKCGSSNYCCPAKGGTWTTNMSGCTTIRPDICLISSIVPSSIKPGESVVFTSDAKENVTIFWYSVFNVNNLKPAANGQMIPQPVCVISDNGDIKTIINGCPVVNGVQSHQLTFQDMNPNGTPNMVARTRGTRTVTYEKLKVTDLSTGKTLLNYQVNAYFSNGGSTSLAQPACARQGIIVAQEDRPDICLISSIVPTSIKPTESVVFSSKTVVGKTADRFWYSIYNVNNIGKDSTPQPVCVTSGGDITTTINGCPVVGGVQTHHLTFEDPIKTMRNSGTRTVTFERLKVKDMNKGGETLLNYQVNAYMAVGNGPGSVAKTDCSRQAILVAQEDRPDICLKTLGVPTNVESGGSVVFTSDTIEGETANRFWYSIYNRDNLKLDAVSKKMIPQPVCVKTGGDITTTTRDCPSGTHHLTFQDPKMDLRPHGTKTVKYEELKVIDSNTNKVLQNYQMNAYVAIGNGPGSVAQERCTFPGKVIVAGTTVTVTPPKATNTPVVAKCTRNATATTQDFANWKRELVSGGFGAVSKTDWMADYNCDGKITLVDFSIWREAFIKIQNATN